MRYVLLALLLAACANFAEVQKTDSIEAYEAWLKDTGAQIPECNPKYDPVKPLNEPRKPGAGKKKAQ